MVWHPEAKFSNTFTRVMPYQPNKAKHSHKTSLAPEDFLQLRLTEGETIEEDRQPLMSPNLQTSRKASLRKSGSTSLTDECATALCLSLCFSVFPASANP